MSAKDKEFQVEITEDEYRQSLAEGADPEYALKPGTYTVRRNRFVGRMGPQRGEVPRKTRVNMWLDADVVEFFKQRADAPNAAPYQTQINTALRQFMERQAVAGRGGAHDFEPLLRDEDFISAVAERVKQDAGFVAAVASRLERRPRKGK